MGKMCFLHKAARLSSEEKKLRLSRQQTTVVYTIQPINISWDFIGIRKNWAPVSNGVYMPGQGQRAFRRHTRPFRTPGRHGSGRILEQPGSFLTKLDETSQQSLRHYRFTGGSPG